MKTSPYSPIGKRFLLALFVLAITTSFFSLTTSGQELALVHELVAKDNAPAVHTKIVHSPARFQAIALPVENTQKVKVLFDNPFGAGVLIMIRNHRGQVVYQKQSHLAHYIGDFDLSPLANGTYSVEVSALTKLGFASQSYVQAFSIGSQTEPTLKAVNPKLQKELYKRRPYQARR
jgi:hypothetical protein